MILGFLGLTAAKWITIGKVTCHLGTALLTMAPAVESYKAKRSKK